MISLPRYIERAVSSYLKAQIESGDIARTKRALQEVCKLYRDGSRFLPDQLYGIELQIVGLLMSSEDGKVRRWALNALAQLGREVSCKSSIVHALKTYHSDAEVLAAAIAALYRLCRDASTDLRKMGFDEKTVILAALQHVPASRLDLSCLPLRIEHADAELIKLGLIVVGLNRAPTNMFEPNYSNAEIVRVIGGHDDPIVSQYSVWAITENPALGVKDLGINLKNVEGLPANVRAWVFQLLAIDSGQTDAHADYIKLAIEDRSAEARMGLAVGLKNIFSPLLVPLVLEWFTREMDPEIRAQILDHLVRQAERSDAYAQHALEAFGRGNSDARDRMLATAAGLPFYSKLSAIKYNGPHDLFGGTIIVNNSNTYNVNHMQAGAVAMGGDASQSGTTINTYNQQTLEVIQSRLLDAEREVKASVADHETKKDALLMIEAAQKEPTKDNLMKALSAIERVESVATKALGIGTALAGIIHQFAQAAGIS